MRGEGREVRGESVFESGERALARRAARLRAVLRAAARVVCCDARSAVPHSP